MKTRLFCLLASFAAADHRARYILGKDASSVCPRGSLRISSSSECESAALALGLARKNRADWTSATGCIWPRSVAGRRTIAAGSTNKRYGPICKLMPNLLSRQTCDSWLPGCCVSRRFAMTCSICLTGYSLFTDGSCQAREDPSARLEFKTAPSGLQWADAKFGTGSPFGPGSRVTIDYVMSTTGARYGTKIDSTTERQAPYSWTLGDGSTIPGLEQAVAGGDGVPPMLPGGVRRAIIPSKLAYEGLAKPSPGLQIEECKGGYGPIPPREVKAGDLGEAAFQRFKNIYCNSNRGYQPDLVLDIKLFGKRVAPPPEILVM